MRDWSQIFGFGLLTRRPGNTMCIARMRGLNSTGHNTKEWWRLGNTFDMPYSTYSRRSVLANIYFLTQH